MLLFVDFILTLRGLLLIILRIVVIVLNFLMWNVAYLSRRGNRRIFFGNFTRIFYMFFLESHSITNLDYIKLRLHLTI